MSHNDPMDNDKKEDGTISDSTLTNLIWHEIKAIRSASHSSGNCQITDGEYLSEEMLWQFVEKSLGENDEKMVKKHLDRFEHCRAYVNRIKSSIEEASQVVPLTADEAKSAIAIRQRQKMKAGVWQQIKDFMRFFPESYKTFFNELSAQLENKINTIFTYPSPRLEPVFGASHDFLVYSPFGKVRFPIQFRWEPLLHAEKYEISIDEIQWNCITRDKECLLEQKPPEMDYGLEYSWKLRIYSSGQMVDEAMGFFELATFEEHEKIKEIEQRVSWIKDAFGRFVIWAQVLESKRFGIEAIENYIKAYSIHPVPGIAYSIACCYDLLELEELRDEWNNQIPVEQSV
jgi:hypothetical protein